MKIAMALVPFGFLMELVFVLVYTFLGIHRQFQLWIKYSFCLITIPLFVTDVLDFTVLLQCFRIQISYSASLIHFSDLLPSYS